MAAESHERVVLHPQVGVSSPTTGIHSRSDLPHPQPEPSLWQGAYREELPDPWSLAPLNDRPYDYAIIGSGISGLYTALKILEARPNSRVIMLEAREFCSGATGRSSGLIKPSIHRSYLANRENLGIDEALSIAAFESRALKSLARLAAMHDPSQPGQVYAEDDTVDFIYDLSTFNRLVDAIETMDEDCKLNNCNADERTHIELPTYRILSPSEAKEEYSEYGLLDPIVNDDHRGETKLAGAIQYRCSIFDPIRLAYRLLRQCLNYRDGHLGTRLRLYTNTPVKKIEYRAHFPTYTYAAEKCNQLITGSAPSQVLPNLFYAKEVVVTTNG